MERKRAMHDGKSYFIEVFCTEDVIEDYDIKPSVLTECCTVLTFPVVNRSIHGLNPQAFALQVPFAIGYRTCVRTSATIQAGELLNGGSNLHWGPMTYFGKKTTYPGGDPFVTTKNGGACYLRAGDHIFDVDCEGIVYTHGS